MDKPKDEVNIMIDIETLGTNVNTAPILSIGACAFCSEGIIERTFYSMVDLNFQMLYNSDLKIDVGTLQWWAAQSTPMPVHGTEPIESSLERLKDWIYSFNVTPVIWSKGPQFDIAILTRAFMYSGQISPWQYSSVRDYRTVAKLFPFIQPRIATVSHDALADAIQQALHLTDIFNALGAWYDSKELIARLKGEKNGLDNSEDVSGRDDPTECGTGNGPAS